MRFTVSFKGTGGSYAVSMDSKTFGVEGLDLIRDELGVPSLSTKVINSEIGNRRLDVNSQEVTEDFARRCPHFKTKSHIEVLVPHRFLNEFTYEKVYANRDPGTDEIKVAGITQGNYDPQEILDTWESEGFPLNWGFDETDQKAD